MNETKNFTESLETRHSKWTFLSNAFGLLCSTSIGAIQGYTLFYYEIVIGLNSFLVFIATTIFVVYNAINDPIFGFLIDRNLRFTRKWGRRFPWIVISIVPWVFSIYLHFSVPNIDVVANPWAGFGWLLLTLVLLDTFGTLVNINYSALRVEKFQTEYERRRFTKYYAPIDILAIVLGMLLPELLVDVIPGDIKASYSMMGAIIAIIALIFGILSFHGNREDKIMIDKYFSPDYEKRESFLNALIAAVKTRSFVVWLIFGTCLGIQIALVVTNALYLSTFILRDTSLFLIIMVLNLLGTLISIPIWLRYIKKINDNKKALIIAGLASCAALLPLTFFIGLFDLMIWAFVLGLAQGGLNSYVYTIVGPSVTEDVIVKSGKNMKGVFFGVSAMFARLVTSLDELIFAVVHNSTGFIAGKKTYAEMLSAVTAAGGDINLVLIGIRLLQGVIPALILFIGLLIVWKFFPITQERLLKNKAKMKELGF